MVIIEDYCVQKRRYGDSYGKCIIKLEEGDNADAIISEYTRKREWYEQTYSHPQRVNHYELNLHGKSETYDGDLLVFDTYRTYLD